jgi:hypothetical protein
MTALNKFKKFMTNLNNVVGKKLKEIFGKVKTFLSNCGNIVNTIKTVTKVVKGIKDMYDGKGVNFKNLLKVGKDNFSPLLNQALPQEEKTIQGTLNPLIQLKNLIFT